MRTQSVEVFSSALCLATLCGTYFLEVLPQIVEPTVKRLPLVSTVVGVLSVLHNALVLGLTWARLPGGGPDHGAIGRAETGGGESGRGGAEADRGASYWADALVFSNPGALAALEPEAREPRQDPGPPGPASEVRVPSIRSDGLPDGVGCGRRGRARLRAAAAALFPALFPAVLAVVQGLLLMLAAPQCVPASLSCTSLVHLDVAFSMMAIAVLLVAAGPQVYRYGLLLLQASPASVSMADLKGEISRVAGVQSLHHFHVWQLTETRSVASVHVRCQDGFQKHRCGDLIAAVTKVFQAFGISCCTIQPEFPPPPALGPGPADRTPSSAPPGPPSRACGLACGAACQEKMCCSPREEL
ncbi:unnamed protein product [Boreogadus saida]